MKGNEGRWLQSAKKNERSQWKIKCKEVKEDEMNGGNGRAKRDCNIGRNERNSNERYCKLCEQNWEQEVWAELSRLSLSALVFGELRILLVH
jgi:hypothetical protein